jgi:ATP-dependent RNA helicase DeaD
MTNPKIAAPLAAALASKGYDDLTAVQEAMLADGLEGRDLLVSAQTGSGKTVAFGLAIAPDLLAGQMELAVAPLALVVAPTRELALQVQREFQWLYAETGAQIASCVGGMDFRTERRALDKGAAIVVGTPGRLRDHIERNTLDLSALRAVVLDEADEMLDLGFQEDLEFILGAAPGNKRTLMFSATVPKDIEKLAATYQRNAQRVIAQGEARQHVDITYKGMSVALRDKENAILNLLRHDEPRMAIVFCKTRAAVTHLHARMGNRGFRVVALSGELSQAERSHALQALRDGRANICIATDVAARGIDLPGLELVIHFDLPSNSETLLHRSGRTGRAGAKGVSMLIATPADYKKAQRLLQGARLDAEWVKPPTADEVQAADDTRMLALEVFNDDPTEDEEHLVESLLGIHGAEGAALGLIRLYRAGRSAPEVVGDLPPPTPDAGPRRERSEFGPAVWFSLSVGHSGRAEARWLLPKLCEAGRITRDAIGAIRVKHDVSFVQIAAAAAGGFGEGLEIESGLMMTRMDGEPDLNRADRDSSAPRKPYAKRDEGDRKPYAPRDDAPRKPYVKRDEGDRKPYTPRPLAEDGPRKPYVKREDGDRKPYAPREDGDRKPYTPRPLSEDAPRKPYVKRDEGDRKPYAPRDDAPRKPYVKREDGDRKPYAPRDDAARKPRAMAEDGPRKPYAKRAEGDFKPRAPRAGDDAPRKPWAKDGDAPRKPRAKPEGRDDKPRSKGGDARPARAPAPKPDFSNTSVSLRKPRTTKPFGTGPKPGPKKR